ncbi:DNA primase large subunit [Megachile rotundata]|uniref:DNA primase large subunit n=1 Tax=Megachile rotundata TaxID=143995 RepID=UPI000614A1F4|nr:PREDICTED: DNA primase large subunit-like [Megachile rotundata]
MFYIRAPSGRVPLHVLEKCVMVRLEYLQLLHEGRAHDFKDNFEYLLDNSVYDKIGHFTLRLLASTSKDLCDYWFTREKLFFRTRLNHILPRQLYRLFRSILRQLQPFPDKETLINKTLTNLCNFFSKSSVFKHLVSTCNNDCKLFKTTVRFELLPDLVRKRELELNAGFAIVHCSNWKEIIASLFTTYITKELICMKSKGQYILNQDTRFHCLYQKVRYKVFKNSSLLHNGRISKSNIDIEAKYFPLCMQHLHMKLRNVHRLSHYARFHYSLFLKDGGMHIEEAINYWKEEYSKPHSCTSVCAHDWQSSEKKFIYSIRHLYGLEGSRKNYNSPSCKLMFANISSPMYEGGCPFKHFDRNTLHNLLSLSLPNNQVNKILATISSQNPQNSCAEVFKILSQTNNSNVTITSPLQYYLKMINEV